MDIITLKEFLEIAAATVDKLENQQEFNNASQLLNYRNVINNYLIDIYNGQESWTKKEANDYLKSWYDDEIERLEEIKMEKIINEYEYND